MLLLLPIHPALRILLGCVSLALGLVFHLVWLDLIAAVVIAVSAAQWYRGRTGPQPGGHGLRR